MPILLKATFQRVSADGTLGAPLSVNFNPTEYTLNKGAQIAEIAIPGLDSPILQFVRGQTETLSLDLFFDSTDSGMDDSAEPVTTLTDQFYQLVKIDGQTHAPPVCFFSWGATLICNLPVKQGQAGLNINIDTNPSPNEMPRTFVYMKSQYDIVFILELARRNGYVVYIEDDDGSGKPTLYFGLSQNPALAPVYQLEWGKSLISFKPTLATARQISKVTVQGWDRTSNTQINQSFALQDLWKEQKKSATEIARLTLIADAFKSREEVVTDQPVHTSKEAKELARAMLTNTNNTLIEATGSTIGLPDLRAGCTITIVGFGITTGQFGQLTGAASAFDGQYYVTETTHTIGNGGYQTEFSAQRRGAVDAES